MLMDQRVTWMKKRIDFVSPGNCGLVRLVFFPQHIQADLRFTLPCLSNRQHPFLKNLTLLSRCFSASSLCRCCSSCWRITMPGTSVEFLQYLQYLRPVFWRLGLCSWKLCLKNDDDDVVWKMIQPAERQISASRVGSEGGRGSSGNAGKLGKYKFIR